MIPRHGRKRGWVSYHRDGITVTGRRRSLRLDCGCAKIRRV